MAVWEELRAVLVRLRDQQPGALMRYPALDANQDRKPPVTIGLAPWATAADCTRRPAEDRIPGIEHQHLKTELRPDG
jgi:hypothetical protein